MAKTRKEAPPAGKGTAPAVSHPLLQHTLFREICESYSDSILVWDRNFDYLFANQVSIDHVGLDGVTPENIIGKNIEFALGHIPEFMNVWKGRMNGVFESGKAAFFKDRMPVVDRIVHSETAIYPIRGNSEEVGAVCVVYRDVSDREDARLKAERQAARNEGMNRILRETITAEEDEQIAKIALAVLEEITESAFGFIGELNENGKLDTIALSDPGFAACRIPESDALVVIRDMEIRGLWSLSLKDGESRIFDDPENEPDSVGLPEGHPPLRSLLTVPLRRGEKVYGVVALANRKMGYGPEEREAVEQIAPVVSTALFRKRAEQELERHRGRLQEMVEERTAELSRTNENLQLEIRQRQTAEKEAEEATRQLQVIFDNYPEIIYVADPETYEILFANKVLEEAIGRKVVGETCYRALQGFDSPCSFCTNEIILQKKGEPYTWEHHNPVMEQDFLIVDQIIRWPDGRDVRLEIANNITGRKKAERELERSEESLRITLESIGDGVIATDTEKRIVRMNRTAEQLTGWSSEEAMGSPLVDVFRILNEETRAYVPDPVQKVLESGKIEDLANHTVLIDREGRERPIADSAAPIRNADGEIAGVVLVFRDVSSERDQERERDRLVRDLKERVKEFGCLVELGRIIEQRGIDMERIYRDAVALLPPAWQHPEIACARIRSGNDVYETHDLPETEWRLDEPIRVNGEEVGSVTVFYREERSAGENDPFLKEERRLLEAFADRLGQRAEHAGDQNRLRESEERYRTLFNTAPLPLLELEFAGFWKKVDEVPGEGKEAFQTHEEHHPGFAEKAFQAIHVREANRRAMELFGARDKEQIDGALGEIFLAESSRALLNQTAAIAGGTRSFETEVEIRTLMGEARNVIFVLSLAGSAGKVELGLAGIVDITARKEMEEELTRSNKELEHFAHVASHDLQEPLRKIRAFGDRLESKYKGLLDESGQDFLTRMLGAAERMQQLLADMLLVSRVTTRGQEFVSADLGEIAGEVIADLDLKIEKNGGTVETGALPEIEADRMQMHQLLRNLVENGLKYHREGTPPVVRIEGGITEEGWAEIRVADNGIGFDVKYLDRIFTIFQRLHGREEFEGTGVGLTICRRIVERHGGKITAESEIGKGSIFVVTLPVRQARA